MQRSKIASFILISVILTIAGIWTFSQFDKPSEPYSLSDSTLKGNHAFVAINPDARFDPEISATASPIKLPESGANVKEQSAFKVLPKVTPENLKAICRWTNQRLAKLDYEIRKSGEGSNSQHCEEFDLRRTELVTNQCEVDFKQNYQEFC